MNLKNVANLSEMMMLEVFMFYLYKDISAGARKGGYSETHETASELALAELHDGLTILRNLRDQHTWQAIRQLMSAAPTGPFVTRASEGEEHELFGSFIQDAQFSGQTELATWLREVQEEEKVHEQLLDEMAANLRCPTTQREYKLNPALVSQFLSSGLDFFFDPTVSNLSQGSQAYSAMANEVVTTNSPDERIFRDIQLARYTYKPW